MAGVYSMLLLCQTNIEAPPLSAYSPMHGCLFYITGPGILVAFTFGVSGINPWVAKDMGGFLFSGRHRSTFERN